MSAAQVAARLGLSTTTVLEMETREPSGKVTLETLDRCAHAMGCKLVYAVVPDSSTSLEEMVQAHAIQAAKRLSERATQSMGLEQQPVDEEETEAQVKELARALMDKMSPSIWETE
jgi:predicted DNA-binding mobile mystery protein A